MEVNAFGPVHFDVKHGAMYASSIELLKAPTPTPDTADELEALIEEARRRARRRRLGIAAVLGAVGLGLAAFYFAVGFGGGSGAGESPSPRPGAAAGVQYTRTKTLTLGMSGDYSFRQPIVQEAWVGADGSGRLRTTELPAEWPGPRDRSRAIAANDRFALKRARATGPLSVKNQTLSSSAAFDDALGGGSFPATDGLSSNPAELRDQLQAFVAANGGPTSPVRTFEIGSAVLGKPNTPKAVRAAAFRVLSKLPGVAVDRSATDPMGRRTISASITSADTGAASTKTVYFDPQRSLQLAYTDRLTRPENFINSNLLDESIVTKAKTVSSVP
jgi:hypothetical protein